jgi:RNA methyltransferase, TrmH family
MAGLALVITSPANPRLKLIKRLQSRRQRERLGLFVCEGEDLVEAGRAAGAEPAELLVAGEDVEPDLLADVSMLAHPPRVVAVFRRADLPAAIDESAGLALWRVADPGNVGTLLRAADAFGAAVFLSAGCADPTGPKALRASMGSVFRVPTGRFEDAPGRRIALVPRGAAKLGDLDLSRPVTFVLGAEREGLPENIVAACDATASIPLEEGAESLNVAVAGAIALYSTHIRPQDQGGNDG